jgi:hypothetical protein
MYPDSEFDEEVLFEVPADYADKLWVWLKPTRLTWLHRTDDCFFVVAPLRAERDDLARLLREVQAWLDGSDLPYLTFVLDGREYVLPAHAEALADTAA